MLAIVIALVLLLSAVGVIAAQTTPGPAIDWFTVAAGGGRAAGGNITLDGVVGQPIAGPSSGGNVSLEAGYLYAHDLTNLYLPMVRK